MNKKVINTEHNGEKLTIVKFDNRRFCGELIGRSDMSGTPIKEGDIIEVHGKVEWGGVVAYSEMGCGFRFETDDSDSAYTFSHGWGESQEVDPEKGFKIVGSIYE